jgi:quinoprotein glucose dehydrogenase
VLDAWRARLPTDDPLAASLVSLEGGDIERGRRIVTGHVGAQCLRCHALGGGGGHAGPSLEGVAARHDRRGLLESLVNPNARLAQGFGPTSAMPAMTTLLTPREIRDVVAYLSTLK